MNQIDIENETIELAIEQGLNELGVTRDEVEIEVLKQPGMFSKAKVRLTKASVVPQQPRQEFKAQKTLEDLERELEEAVARTSSSVEQKQETTSQNQEHEEPQQNKIVRDYVGEDFGNEFSDLSTYGGKVLAKICKELDENTIVTERKKDRTIIYEIQGSAGSLLIGKNGEAAENLQMLLNVINRHKDSSAPHIVVKIDEYEKMREKALEREATKAADRAIEINNIVRLKEMNSYERRVVHAFLQKDERVITESFGVEPYRYITVRPKDLQL